MARPQRFSSGLIAAMVLLLVQFLCAGFFISEFVTEVFGLRNWAVTWEVREILQASASIGLLLGTVAGLLLLRVAVVRMRRAERQVQAASGEFFAMMEVSFSDWGLSPSERDVALFAVRGMSNAEIARLRGTSEATIKSQMNAVFRKAGVSSRAQLISQFVELLIERAPPPEPSAAPTDADAAEPVSSGTGR